MKLHLGCGDFSLSGWINIDQRMQPGVDRVDNIGMLRRFSPGCADTIYCSHGLDHFSRWDYKRVLARWYELLKDGGELWISTIDFATIAKLYLFNHVPLRSLTGALAAAQDYPSNVRHVHFDELMLTEDLQAVGFKKFQRLDRPFYEADCSAAKCGDVLTSLNLIATK